MYGVELYAAVRLAVVDEGLSHHEAGRRFGIDRRTLILDLAQHSIRVVQKTDCRLRAPPIRFQQTALRRSDHAVRPVPFVHAGTQRHELR